MIRFILLQNRQGKTRLAKYYVPLEELRSTKLNTRDPKFTNFVEVSSSLSFYPHFLICEWRLIMCFMHLPCCFLPLLNCLSYYWISTVFGILRQFSCI
ncbi:hypothetical protein AMTRI_Chr09g19770 [Amborella trichopoda]